LSELVDDWVKHGIEVIQKVREKKPEVYLQVISRLLHKIWSSTWTITGDPSASIHRKS